MLAYLSLWCAKVQRQCQLIVYVVHLSWCHLPAQTSSSGSKAQGESLRVTEQQGLFCDLHSSVTSPTTQHQTGTPPSLALPMKLIKEITFNAKGFSQQDGLSKFRSPRGLYLGY